MVAGLKHQRAPFTTQVPPFVATIALEATETLLWPSMAPSTNWTLQDAVWLLAIGTEVKMRDWQYFEEFGEWLSFDVMTNEGQLSIYRCPYCSALVEWRDDHTEWHKTLEAAQ